MDELTGVEWLQQQQDKLDLYNSKKAELRESRRGLGRIGYLRYLPYPKQFISMLLGLLVFFSFIIASPMIFTLLIEQYIPQGPDGRTLFIVLLMYAVVLTGLFIVVLSTGGPIKAFMKARFMGKDIVEVYNTSNRKEYVVPQDVIGDVYDLDENRAIMPTDESFYNGPNGRRMTSAIPELPVTFNPRRSVNHETKGIDMMSLKVYGIKNQQRQWEKDKSGREWIKPFLMPLVLIVVMGLLLGPFFYEKMGEYDQVRECRQQFDQYRDEAMRTGYVPPAIKEEIERNDPTKIIPAQTGGGVRSGG